MSLRSIANADLSKTLDAFGEQIKITSPTGQEHSFVGLVNDIGVSVDPDSGLPVSGRAVSVSVQLVEVETVFGELAKNEIDQAEKPWLASYDNLSGTTETFKIRRTHPDKTIGLLTLILGFYG